VLSHGVGDLARSFFALNLWLPNVGSPIRLEYLYSVFEHLYPQLSKVDKIQAYADFESLCKALLDSLPTFSYLEDYLPESDWGDIKYYYGNRFYKIFYGASLLNPVDFYAAFEIIHAGFDAHYRKLIGRSPLTEFQFCLSIQDMIISRLAQAGAPRDKAEPGYLETPPEWFWTSCSRFLDEFSFRPGGATKLADQYSYIPEAVHPVGWPDLMGFSKRAVEGKNCYYFFIRCHGRYYPAMPRKYLSVLYDTWGDLLGKHIKDIEKANRHVNGMMDVELFKYIGARTNENNVFGLVTALESGDKPQGMTFACAIHADDRLYLIHIVPIVEYLKDLNGYLKALEERLAAVTRCLSNAPMRLGVWSEQKIVEFRANVGKRLLEPAYLVTTPYLRTEIRSIVLPKNFPAILIPIDQLLGVLDEAEDPSDMNRFLDFRKGLLSNTSLMPFNSFLDLFAAYRDSHAVLLGGASVPSHVILDPNMGTGYRFASLAEFWKNFPEPGFMGDPRSWMFPKNTPPKVLKSKRFWAYVHFEIVGQTAMFINCPAHLLTINEGKLTELVMHGTRDAFTVYSKMIAGLAFTREVRSIQVFCAPVSAVRREEELKHLRDLDPKQVLWKARIVATKRDEAGIALVFDDQQLSARFLDAGDRSMQIDLLTEVLNQVQTLWPDDTYAAVSATLTGERSQPNRFRLYLQTKKVSIPEYVPEILPRTTDLKLANKKVAEIAHALQVPSSQYTGEQAKQILNNLIGGVIKVIDQEVAQYDISLSLPLLIRGVEALIHVHDTKTVQIQESLRQQVEYDRPSSLSENKDEFVRDHRTYRYLIEKFVRLSPTGQRELTIQDLRRLLALADRLLNLYVASDAVAYGILPATLTIDSEFIATVTYGKDVEEKQKAYRVEKANIQLGLVGNKGDVPELAGVRDEFLAALDDAFRQDMGFSIRNVVEVLKILSLWAVCRKVPDNSHYSAIVDEIKEACASQIRNFDAQKLEPILDLLTVTSGEVAQIVGNASPESDIPVWEYAKRKARYAIRPLIKLGGTYHWGPYSASRAGQLWMNVSFTYKLPLPLDARATKAFLKKAHVEWTNQLQIKIAEIVRRATSCIASNIYLHKLDLAISDIGDCDVLAYFPEKGLLLNIESKIIDPAYCLKDARRIAEKIYGRQRENASIERGYLNKVELRHEYLKKNAAIVVRNLGWGAAPDEISVKSLFVTQDSYWWTRYPPVGTEVRFVECRMLNDAVGMALDEVSLNG